MRYCFFLILFCISAQASSAKEIFLAVGRIALIDLGSIIKNNIQVVHPDLVNIYSLSGIDDENTHSIIAIQGLKDSGKTDLLVSTSYGLEQLTVILNKDLTEDYSLVPNNSRLQIIQQRFMLNPQRSSIISLKKHINKNILASDPSLIRANELLDYYDENYLKTFSIISSANEGLVDLIIPSKAGVYKLTLEINKEALHEAVINLP
jgi:hypothetical protein